MTNLTALQSLRDRVAKATGPDRHADTLIAHGTDGWTIKKIGGKPHFSHPEEVPVARDGRPSNYPSYTSSIDAALAWVERVLPGWRVDCKRLSAGWPGPSAVNLISDDDEPMYITAHAPTSALAIILAGLDALIEKEKSDGTA